MKFKNRFLSLFAINCFFAFCLFSINEVPEAKADTYSHISSGVCADFLDDMSKADRRKYAQMHAAHLAQMRPLYREYTKLEKPALSSKYYGYGTEALKKQELKKYKEEKKRVEQEIEDRENAFAKEVFSVFGKKLKVSKRHVIRHGEGRACVCGFVTVF